MEDDKIVKIDIDKVLQSKMGAKSKFVPRFICNWLKHIVHQEEINAFLESVGGKQGLPWLDAVMDFLDDKIEEFVQLTSKFLNKDSLFVIGDYDREFMDIDAVLQKCKFKKVLKNVYKKV